MPLVSWGHTATKGPSAACWPGPHQEKHLIQRARQPSGQCWPCPQASAGGAMRWVLARTPAAALTAQKGLSAELTDKVSAYSAQRRGAGEARSQGPAPPLWGLDLTVGFDLSSVTAPGPQPCRQH